MHDIHEISNSIQLAQVWPRSPRKGWSRALRGRPARLLAALLGVVLLRPLAALAEDDPGALADRAVAANPGLAALRARTSELRALVPAAGLWRDPVARIDYQNAPIDSFSLNDKPQSAMQFSLQQTVPPMGWSDASRRVALRSVVTQQLAVREAELQLRREVYVLFHRLTLSRQLEEVTRSHIRRAEELLRAARARYETGGAGQHQLLGLELLRDRLVDDLSDFARSDRELSAGLARALSRPSDLPFEAPSRLAAMPVPGSLEEWKLRAGSARPELKRLESAARTAEAQADLARIEARPDVTLQLIYRRRTVDLPIDDGTDQVTAGITVPLPFSSARRSAARQLAFDRVARAERARRAETQNQVDAGLESIHARWARAYEKADVYARNLLPSAMLAVETALAEYSVGRADFSTLYQAEVDLLNIERGRLQAVVQTHIEAAELEAMMGTLPEGAVR